MRNDCLMGTGFQFELMRTSRGAQVAMVVKQLKTECSKVVKTIPLFLCSYYHNRKKVSWRETASDGENVEKLTILNAAAEKKMVQLLWR